MIKLSVIIPIYNTPEPLLEHCISSIQENLQQMGDEVEVLLINDGSTVSYIEPMFKAVEAADNRFKYVYKANSGVSATRNLGIDMAQGEYITFVDSDDYLEPDALQYMIETMDKIDAEIGFYGFVGDSTIGNSNYTRYIKMMSEIERERVLINLISFIYGIDHRSHVDHHCPWGKVFMKSHLDRYHIRYHTGLLYAEDTFFNFCYMTFAKKVYVDNKLTSLRSSSCIYNSKMFRWKAAISSNITYFMGKFYPSQFPHKHIFATFLKRPGIERTKML